MTAQTASRSVLSDLDQCLSHSLRCLSLLHGLHGLGCWRRCCLLHGSLHRLLHCFHGLGCRCRCCLLHGPFHCLLHGFHGLGCRRLRLHGPLLHCFHGLHRFHCLLHGFHGLGCWRRCCLLHSP